MTDIDRCWKAEKEQETAVSDGNIFGKIAANDWLMEHPEPLPSAVSVSRTATSAVV